jgi:branched-chain amino acid transport system permease protein
MGLFITALINGVILGCAYSLIAIGFTMFNGILRIVNFAHPAIYVFGAYAIYFLYSHNMGLALSVILGILLTGVCSFLVDRITLLPLRKKKSKQLASLITTLGVSTVITNFLSADSIFGSEKRPFPALTSGTNFQLGSVVIQRSQILMLIVSIASILVLAFIVNRTKLGLAMKATQQNPTAANLMGIDTSKVIAITFLICGIMAGIAAALITGYYQVLSPTMGNMTGMKAFAAAVVGGLDSVFGAVVGGWAVGISESLAAQYIGSNVRDPMAFVILIIILLIKPNGFFGKKSVTKI